MASTTIPQPVSQPTQQIETPEPSYWAGNEELTQFLEENGYNSVQELLQYTATQESGAQQAQEILQFAIHPDPEVRQEFWNHYHQSLQQQGLIPEEAQHQQHPQAPSFPGTPDGGYQGYPQQQGFGDMGQFFQQFSIMNSGLPGVTPQHLAQFDQGILMTPGQFWAEHIFDLGEI